jgi:HD-like signal output (HDOD) protein
MSAARKLTPEYIAERLDELPTLPTVVHELSKLINDPMSTTKQIEGVMENDQSLTAKVLKLINSAYYAIPGGVSSLSRAIAYLGFDTVNQLVLATSIIKALDTKDSKSFDITGFWTHSIGVAVACETIGKVIKHSNPSEIFTCGLIHDVGKIALLVLDLETLLAISAHARANNLTFDEAEDQLQTVKHDHIGFLLAKKWNLPLHIQNSVRYHHQTDSMKRGGISVELNQMVDVTILANLLVHALKFGNSGYDKIGGAPKDVLKRLSIDLPRLKEVTAEIKSALDSTEGFLKIIREG